jgi:hypothetical protein
MVVLARGSLSRAREKDKAETERKIRLKLDDCRTVVVNSKTQVEFGSSKLLVRVRKRKKEKKKKRKEGKKLQNDNKNFSLLFDLML